MSSGRAWSCCIAGIVRMLSRHVEKHTIIGLPSSSPTSRARSWSHRTEASNASVVSRPEPYLSLRHAISNRLTAVLGERRRIKHAVADLALGLAAHDAVGNNLSVELEAHVRL